MQVWQFMEGTPTVMEQKVSRRRSEGLGGRLLYFRAPLFGNLPAFRCLTDNPRVLPIHGAAPEWKSRPRLRVTPVPPRTTG